MTEPRGKQVNLLWFAILLITLWSAGMMMVGYQMATIDCAYSATIQNYTAYWASYPDYQARVLTVILPSEDSLSCTDGVNLLSYEHGGLARFYVPVGVQHFHCRTV